MSPAAPSVPLHLARRFFGSLVARPLGDDERAWVQAQLSTGEWGLWQELSRADRRHSLTVAREVERRLHGTTHLEDSRWLAAALLHDVGKVDARLGTVARVAATLLAAFVGRRRVAGWSARRGALGRVGRYAEHPRLGSARIGTVGGRPEAAAWAAVHHRAETEVAWGDTVDRQQTSVTVPAEVVDALRAADDD